MIFILARLVPTHDMGVHMENIRCLIANIPQQVLVDIILNITNNDESIQVVDRVETIENLPDLIQANDIDVLLVGVTDQQLPKLCDDVFSRVKDTLVFGLIDDGRRAAVYLDDVGIKEVACIVKELGAIKHLSKK